MPSAWCFSCIAFEECLLLLFVWLHVKGRKCGHGFNMNQGVLLCLCGARVETREREGAVVMAWLPSSCSQCHSSLECCWCLIIRGPGCQRTAVGPGGTGADSLLSSDAIAVLIHCHANITATLIQLLYYSNTQMPQVYYYPAILVLWYGNEGFWALA